MSSCNGRNSRIKRGCVSKRGVLVAGCKRAGYAAHRAAVRDVRSRHLFAAAFLFGSHFASHVDFRAGDVAMHIDSTRHDHQSAGIDRF